MGRKKGAVPNLIELGKSPQVVRYFWAIMGERIHSGCTWQGLIRAWERLGKKEFLFIDFQNKIIYEVDKDFEAFMDKWRVHYQDPNWDYGSQ